MSACLILLLLTYATACLPLPPSAYAAMLPAQHSSTLDTGYKKKNGKVHSMTLRNQTAARRCMVKETMGTIEQRRQKD